MGPPAFGGHPFANDDAVLDQHAADAGILPGQTDVRARQGDGAAHVHKVGVRGHPIVGRAVARASSR